MPEQILDYFRFDLRPDTADFLTLLLRTVDFFTDDFLTFDLPQIPRIIFYTF